jgi:PKD repeat protein
MKTIFYPHNIKLPAILGLILLANPVFAEYDLKAEVDVDRRKVCPKEAIKLNGKGSEGDIDVYKWEVENADRVLVDVLYGETTELLLEEPGVYTITLKVFGKESSFNFKDDSLTVTVDECEVLACYEATISDDREELKPLKKADIKGNKLGNPLAWNLAENGSVVVYVNASCSVNATQYEWKLNGKPISSGVDATIPLEVKGDHIITLTISDKNGKSNDARGEFKIGELIAHANFEPDTDIIFVDQVVQLSSDKTELSSDKTEFGIFNGTEKLVKYHWDTISSDCGDKKCFFEAAMESKTNMFCKAIPKDMDACTYTLILTVNDPNNVTDQYQRKFVIIPEPPKPPIAKINVESPSNQDFGTPPLTVKLNGTSSYSPLEEISIKKYHWTTSCKFEDDLGNTITLNFPDFKGQYFENTFEKLGDCTITLIVIDDNGVESEPDDVIIRVKPILEFSFDGDKQETEGKKLLYGTNSNIAVGLDVNLAKNLKSCPEGVELWAGIYYSESSDSDKKSVLFFTEKTNESHHGLDSNPQPFRTHFSFPYRFKLLETLLPPDIKGGSYTFFAALLSKGKSPVEDINTLCDDPSASAVNFSCPDFPDLVPNILICRTVNVID